MKRKLLLVVFSLLVGTFALTGCNQKEGAGNGTSAVANPEAKPAVENKMQYVSPEDLKNAIAAESDEYIILDARKVADYDENHIKGAYSVDQDSAVQDSKDEEGTANLKAGLNAATGSETGSSDKKYAIICYSGKRYAQKSTDLLIAMGVPSENIYTLEGGITAWNEGGDDYTALLEK